MPKGSEAFRTLYVDPGETTGWSLGRGLTLLGGGQTPMWEFARDFWDSVADNDLAPTAWPFGTGDQPWTRPGIDHHQNRGRIGRVVCEDWRLYPDKLKALQWDECRTARLIGAITFVCQLHYIPLVLQPAAIKERAKAGGAEELYVRPLHENRHQNDSAQHFVFFTQMELVGNDSFGLPPNAEIVHVG